MEKVFIPNFICIDKDVFLDSRLNATEVKLYALIEALSNNNKKTCFAQNDYLCNVMNIEKRQLQYSLKKLKDLNYIMVSYKSNSYREIKTILEEKIIERNEASKNVFDYDWLNDNLEEEL